MNQDIFKGNWQELRGKIKQQWSELTDDDLTSIDGQKDVLLGKIQEKYGISKEQAKKEFTEFYASVAPELEEIKDDAIAVFKHAGESVHSFIKHSPVKALGIAAITGLLIGLRF